MKRRKTQPMILPTQTGSGSLHGPRGYFRLSSQPLHILVFLMPVIVVYELGSMGLLGSGEPVKLEAQELLVRFFDLFGVLGLHLPALALVATLLIQHILSRENWRITPMVPLAMIAESAFLTGPLIILVIILNPQASLMMMPAPGLDGGITHTFWDGLYLSFGAGLYEEMLFRLVLITMLHFIVTDVLRFKDQTGKIAAVLISALAFAWLHDGVYASGAGLNLRLVVFYILAGGYFGILFLSRGLGIAVGAHLMYDLLAFVILPGVQQTS